MPEASVFDDLLRAAQTAGLIRDQIDGGLPLRIDAFLRAAPAQTSGPE